MLSVDAEQLNIALPKLWESVKKEQKWFVGVSGLHIVQLDPIDSHIVVNAKVRVNLR